METATGIKIKLPKNSIHSIKPNAYGYQVGLHVGVAPTVGYMVITRVLKNCYEGYFGRCTHEEFKAGDLYTKDLMAYPVIESGSKAN